MDLVRIFRWTAVAEGISYLAFSATMPLKYGLDILWPNQVVGMAHGGLFLAYCVLLGVVWVREGWSLRRVAGYALASLVPYGTIWLERREFRSPKG